jgi:hypothetical protein
LTDRAADTIALDVNDAIDRIRDQILSNVSCRLLNKLLQKVMASFSGSSSRSNADRLMCIFWASSGWSP